MSSTLIALQHWLAGGRRGQVVDLACHAAGEVVYQFLTEMSNTSGPRPVSSGMSITSRLLFMKGRSWYCTLTRLSRSACWDRLRTAQRGLADQQYLQRHVDRGTDQQSQVRQGVAIQ